MNIIVTKPANEVAAKSGSKLVADVMIGLDEWPGVVIKGFTVWRRPDGSIFVGLPSKPIRKGSYTSYDPYIQPTDGSKTKPDVQTAVDTAIKDHIVQAFIESGLYV